MRLKIFVACTRCAGQVQTMCWRWGGRSRREAAPEWRMASFMCRYESPHG